MKIRRLVTKLRAAVAILVVAMLAMATATATAQTTSFTFQGKLNDVGLAANASCDTQFKLCSFAAGGVQNGSTMSVPAIVVTSGITTARLDFGAVFDGSDKFLEIGVRPAGSNAGSSNTTQSDNNFIGSGANGAVVGVKNDRPSTVFVNAFREQQDENTKQKELIDAQKRKLAAQDEAIATFARRLDELSKRVDGRNSLRRPASRRRGNQTKSRR